MNSKQKLYMHWLLFRCKRCGEVLGISVASEAHNLEQIDGDSHDVRCFCGWTENLLGVEALRHWVTPRENERTLVGRPQGSSPMKQSPMLHKFPEGSANRNYDVFEQLPDGTRVWKACVIGMENVELKLQELARESNNKFLALNEPGRNQRANN